MFIQTNSKLFAHLGLATVIGVLFSGCNTQKQLPEKSAAQKVGDRKRY